MTINYFEHCGAKYPERLQEITLFSEATNIRCPTCETPRAFHPVPIAVLLQPVITDNGETGLLVRRQGKIGDSAYSGVELPSCFCHIGEDTKQVLIRETGIDIGSGTLRDFRICTDPHDKYLYLFFTNEKELHEKDLLLHFDGEDDTRLIITGYDNEQFLFPLEGEMVKKFFDELWYNEPDR